MAASLLPKTKLLRDIIFALQARPEPIYLVGGYIRDWLLRRESHDLDFAVEGEAIPIVRQIADAFHGHFVLLDREHDTGRAIFKRKGIAYYADFARIRGADILADLAARDLTLNAIAVDIKHLHMPSPPLLDPLGGQRDVQERLVRATSGQAFRDDPLRLLRAVRQAAALNFCIVAETEALIRRDAPLIVQSAYERVRDELAQMLALPKAVESLRALDRLGILAHVLPELMPLQRVLCASGRTAYEQAMQAVDAVEHLWQRPSGSEDQSLGPMTELRQRLLPRLHAVLSDTRERLTLLKFAALLHTTGYAGSLPPISEANAAALSAEIAAATLRRLRFSGVEVDLAKQVICHYPWPHRLADQSCLSPHDTYRFFDQLGEAALDVLCLALAVAWACAWPSARVARWGRLQEIVHKLFVYGFEEWPRVLALPRLLDGRELIRALKLAPGPMVGQLLEGIREAQAVGEIHSREEALDWAKRHRSDLTMRAGQ